MSRLLLDTQVLVWVGTDDPRLPRSVLERLFDAESHLFASAVTAWEFADLQQRGRLPPRIALRSILRIMDAQLLDFPAECWEVALSLPDIHRDPIDRMVVAHAKTSGLTLVTADAAMRRYPVECLW